MAKKLRLNREQVWSLCKSQIKSSYGAHLVPSKFENCAGRAPEPSKVDNCAGSFSTV